MAQTLRPASRASLAAAIVPFPLPPAAEKMANTPSLYQLRAWIRADAGSPQLFT
jgi:hypothetical protein